MFKVTTLLFTMLALGCTTHVMAMNEAAPKTDKDTHVEKMMVLDEHMKNMNAQQKDVHGHISALVHNLNQHEKCPSISIDELAKYEKEFNLHPFQSGYSFTIVKDNRKFKIEITSAGSADPDHHHVDLKQQTSKLTPGVFTCEYELKTADGAIGGAFKLALEK